MHDRPTKYTGWKEKMYRILHLNHIWIKSWVCITDMIASHNLKKIVGRFFPNYFSISILYGFTRTTRSREVHVFLKGPNLPVFQENGKLKLTLHCCCVGLVIMKTAGFESKNKTRHPVLGHSLWVTVWCAPDIQRALEDQWRWSSQLWFP